MRRQRHKASKKGDTDERTSNRSSLPSSPLGNPQSGVRDLVIHPLASSSGSSLKPHRPLLLEILRILTWSLARTTSERILQRIKRGRYSRCLIRGSLTKSKFFFPYLGQIFQIAFYFAHSVVLYSLVSFA